MGTVIFSPRQGESEALNRIGEFASPALEARYRCHQLAGDAALARVCAGLALPGYLVFVTSDFTFLGHTPAAWGLVALRCLVAVGCLVVFRVARRPSCPRTFDRVLFAWCLTLALVSAVIGFTRPPWHPLHVVLSALAVLMLFCAVPLPLRLQLPPALLLSGSGILAGLLEVPVAGPLRALAVTTAFVGVTVLGAATSWQLKRRKRELFATARREAKLRGELEKALAEIRTLRGLYAICAYCKKLRDEGGEWHQVEAYVREKTHAEFSHGMCPGCFDEAMGALKEGRTDAVIGGHPL